MITTQTSNALSVIHWKFNGAANGYHVYMDGVGEIYFTKDKRDRDVFIAELKGKLLAEGSAPFIKNDELSKIRDVLIEIRQELKAIKDDGVPARPWYPKCGGPL